MSSLGALPYDLLIFDFDGTLADSKDVLAEVVNRSLVDAGLPAADPRRIHRSIGMPLVRLFATVTDLPAETVSAAISLYRERARAPEVIRRFRLFPGARETLQALSDRGTSVTIATSKPRDLTERILAHFGIEGLIADLVGGDDVERGKPDPEAVLLLLDRFRCPPGRAALVGDTTFDMEMARAAGVAAIAVTYGMHDAAMLAATQPDRFIDDLRELLIF